MKTGVKVTIVVIQGHDVNDEKFKYFEYLFITSMLHNIFF